MYFRLVLEGGHMGAGKSYETVRYFRAENPVDLFSFAARIPRVKGKSRATGVKAIHKVTREEYERGVREGARNPYLQARRSNRASRRGKDRRFVEFH